MLPLLITLGIWSRTKFIPWSYGSFQFPIAWGVPSRTQKMLNWCDAGIQISARRVTESFDTQLMLASGRSFKRSIIWNLEMTWNVRFALSIEGMNLSGKRTSTYNTWIVILTMYKQRTWLHQNILYILKWPI